MDMGMKVHRASPGMQDTDIADISAKIFSISSKFTQGTGCGIVKGIIEKFLVAVNDRV